MRRSPGEAPREGDYARFVECTGDTYPCIITHVYAEEKGRALSRDGREIYDSALIRHLVGVGADPRKWVDLVVLPGYQNVAPRRERIPNSTTQTPFTWITPKETAQ